MDSFVQLSEHLGCALLLFDEGLKIAHANVRAGELLNLPPETLAGLPLYTIDSLFLGPHGADLPEESRPLHQAIQRKKPLCGGEFFLSRKGGSRLRISLNASPLLHTDGRIRGMVADFTRCCPSEERLHQFIGAMDEIVFEFDTRGRFLNIWTENEDLLKAPGHLLLGRSFEEFIPREEADRLFGVLQRIRLTGTPENIEYTLEVLGGKKWFLARVALIPSAAGEEPSFSFVAQDITAQKELEDRLEDYIHMLGHDLRSPLTVISGYAEILRETAPRQEERECTEAILTAVDQMLAMMEDLVEVGRLESGQTTIYQDTLHLGEFTHSFVKGQISDDYRRVRVNIPTDLPHVRLGKHHLERILENLIGNALKYSEPPHPVEVEGFPTEDGQVCLTVRDHGPGISPTDLPRIFERFYRTPSARSRARGSGIGLYITRKLIESYGGSIQVESQAGDGTLFTFCLPATN